MEIRNPPIAKFGMLTRRPASEVFSAFTDPDTITKFWFSRSTGPLEKGAVVHWQFCEHGSCEVRVLEFEENRRLRIAWAGPDEHPTTVTWIFEPRIPDTTYVRIVNEGFSGDGDAMVGAALDASGGFATVLTAAKAYLEFGVSLPIVEDRF